MNLDYISFDDISQISKKKAQTDERLFRSTSDEKTCWVMVWSKFQRSLKRNEGIIPDKASLYKGRESWRRERRKIFVKSEYRERYVYGVDSLNKHRTMFYFKQCL